MRALPLLLLPLLCSCFSSSTLTVYAGQREFDDSDIEDFDVEEQTTIGGELLWGILPWGLGLEAGINYSEEDETILGSIDVDSKFYEAYVGARKTFREDANLRPYVAAGLSYIFTDFDVDGIVDDDDATEAIYAHAGLAYHFTVFHFGVDYRVLALGEADIEGEDVDVDYDFISVFAGLSF